MIYFDCRYALDVPEYMKNACWSGYILDLFIIPTGAYARLILAYPDIDVVDVRLMLNTDSDNYTNVSLMNLKCSFCTRYVHNVEDNARLAYDTNLSIDVASGIAIALSNICKLLECKDWERHENIADYGGLSISVDDVIDMVDSFRDLKETPF